MGRITIDQSHQVMATLAINAAWEEIDFERSGLQDLIIRNPKGAGRQFTAFLKSGGIVSGQNIIHIDRSKPFNPVEFIGKGWTIKEQDERSLAITEMDLSKVRFETCLKPGEISIKGEEKLRRLKESGHIRLDAKIFHILWKNKKLIPERWKEKINGNTCYIFFDGTVLRGPPGFHSVLSLCWFGGRWRWDFRWLEFDWDADYPSAVLAS